MPVASSARVRIAGQPAVLTAATFAIEGCPVSPHTAPGPCVAAHVISGALRVASGGVSLALSTSASVCVPSGAPLVVAAGQARVQAA